MTNAQITSHYNKVIQKYNEVATMLAGMQDPAFVDGRRTLDEKLMDISNEISAVSTWVKHAEFRKLDAFFDKLGYFSQELDDVKKLLSGFGYKTKAA